MKDRRDENPWTNGELAEAAFGECFRKIADRIWEELNDPTLWNEDGTKKEEVV